MINTEPHPNLQARRARLRSVATLCLLFSIPAFLAWLVNLQVAIKIMVTGWPDLLGEHPSPLVDSLVTLSGDLSTISTLVPLLLLVFPLVQSVRILRHRDEAAIHAMQALPYPAHFPFFLVMLGLAGTLYGLWMGLSVSGVSDMGVGLAAAEEVPAVLERLLMGTATALLSSLIGLIGAFLAAKPLPFLFEWAACLEAVEEERSLAETIDHLTRDLKGLSAASREFGDSLQPQAVPVVLESLASMEKALAEQSRALRETVQAVTGMAAAQRENQASIKRINELTDMVAKIPPHLEQATVLFAQRVAAESRLAESLGRLLDEMQSQRHDSTAQMTALREALEQEASASRTERGKLRQAFAAYVGGDASGES